tara:strand:- start:167 stop:1234 length:1068 start_codon:yes stop_codon:yes gene_type:complete
MPTVLQFRRGTTSQNNSFTGALGEITYDTDKDVLRVHDGSTAGGFSMVSASSTDTFTNKTLTSPNITTSIIPTSADGATIGSASKEFSDLFLADAGTIQFGNDQEVQLIHTADTGLILKHTATADDKPVSLTLQTGETDIAADDILGKIDFQAPDEGTGTDSILVAAGILAKSEGDFSTSSNATSLIFKTGASEAATEKVAIRSDGDMRLLTDTATLAMGADQDVTITHVADSGLTLKNSATGDDKPFTMTIQTGETDIAADDVIGAIQFQAPDEGTGTDAITVCAAIKAVSEGDFSASSNATKISFLCGNSEAATEKAKIVGSTGKFHATPDSILLIKNSSGSTLKTVNGHAAI